jgi:hypothetical protein
VIQAGGWLISELRAASPPALHIGALFPFPSVSQWYTADALSLCSCIVGEVESRPVEFGWRALRLCWSGRAGHVVASFAGRGPVTEAWVSRVVVSGLCSGRVVCGQRSVVDAM